MASKGKGFFLDVLKDNLPLAALVGIVLVVMLGLRGAGSISDRIREGRQATDDERARSLAASLLAELAGENTRYLQVGGEVRGRNYRLILPAGYRCYGRALKASSRIEPFFAAENRGDGTRLIIYATRWDTKVNLRSSGLTYHLQQREGWTTSWSEVFFEDKRRPEAVFYGDAEGKLVQAIGLLQEDGAVAAFVFAFAGSDSNSTAPAVGKILKSFEFR